MDENSFLFIGGPRDGEWLRVDDVGTAVVSVPFKTSESSWEPHLYRRIRVVATEHQEWKCYISQDLSDEEVFDRLLHGYKKGK